MARFMKTKRPELVIEAPHLDLVTGLFRRVGARPAAGSYCQRYTLKLELYPTDDSPICRIGVSLYNEEGQAAGRYVMPVLVWQLLANELPSFLSSVDEFLQQQGEDKRKYKRRRKRG